MFYLLNRSLSPRLLEDTIVTAPVFRSRSEPSGVPHEYPLRLIIPSLRINTYVQQVGTRVNGAMASPSNFTDVAWYRYGVVPGQPGSAVIAGHLDNALSLPGVFKKLDKLKKGDDIFIETEGTTLIHFVVKGADYYPYTAFPESVFKENGEPLLSLVTCSGKWLKDKGTYSERLVVTAELMK